MLDIDIPEISEAINSDNYLLNCYNHLSRLKIFHFVFITIEVLLNIFYELETFLKDFQFQNIANNNKRFNYISSINNVFKKMPTINNFVFLLLFLLIIDSLIFYIKKTNFKTKYIQIIILVDLLEIFLFRTTMIFFLNFFFLLNEFLLIFACIFIIPHIYYIMNDFIYNHLYYFVPEFIDYPYDEFSSSFDIVLFIIKILLSISGTTNIVSLGKFSFYIIFFLQVFFSFYFINKLINHSYLFMKNSFLNRTRLGLFFTKTIIIFIAILFGKSEILTIRFLIICISVLLVNMAFMYFLYNPYLHIKIKRESPIINLVFYLFILSEKYDIEFLFEKKLKEHYEQCGICEMCNKFNKYLKIKYNKNLENEEKEKFINEENKNNNVYYKDKLMDLFTIIYNGRNKYFKLIKKIIINYKNKGKEALANKY